MPETLRRLQLAFAYHAVVDLIGADTEVDATEARLRPRRRRGHPHPGALGGGDGRADRLPRRLTVGEKLALVEIVAAASAADGVWVPEEADALAGVARALGVGDRQWLEHLEGLIAVGRLRRDDAGV